MLGISRLVRAAVLVCLIVCSVVQAPLARPRLSRASSRSATFVHTASGAWPYRETLSMTLSRSRVHIGDTLTIDLVWTAHDCAGINFLHQVGERDKLWVNLLPTDNGEAAIQQRYLTQNPPRRKIPYVSLDAIFVPRHISYSSYCGAYNGLGIIKYSIRVPITTHPYDMIDLRLGGDFFLDQPLRSGIGPRTKDHWSGTLPVLTILPETSGSVVIGSASPGRFCSSVFGPLQYPAVHCQGLGVGLEPCSPGYVYAGLSLGEYYCPTTINPPSYHPPMFQQAFGSGDSLDPFAIVTQLGHVVGIAVIGQGAQVHISAKATARNAEGEEKSVSFTADCLLPCFQEFSYGQVVNGPAELENVAQWVIRAEVPTVECGLFPCVNLIYFVQLYSFYPNRSRFGYTYPPTATIVKKG
jgi:hypothetical protein